MKKKLIQLSLLIVLITGMGLGLTHLIPHQILFKTELQELEALEKETISEELKAHFEKAKIVLSADATLKTLDKETSWIIADPKSKRNFTLKKQDNLYVLEEDGIDFAPLIPPLLAIGLALITKEVLSSLFLGVYSAAFLILWKQGFSGVTGIAQQLWFTLQNAFLAFLRVVDQYAIKAVTSESNAKIVLFSLIVGGTVGVVSASGGLRGVVAKLSLMAKNSVLGQFVSFLMGILMFFDDYASCLIVGNTSRPLTDKMRISREKLSFIVDATAAPIASLAIISTWIGTEVGYIGDQIQDLNLELDPYMAFLQSLPFRFYAIFMMIFILLNIFMKRDFGAMYRAEIRARETGETLRYDSLLQKSHSPTETTGNKDLNSSRWYNAVLPILVLIFGVLVGIWHTGRTSTLAKINETIPARIQEIQETLKTKEAELSQKEKENFIKEEKKLTKEIDEANSGWMGWSKSVLKNCDSYNSLLWASLVSSLLAILLVVAQRILTLQETMTAWTQGLLAVLPAILILVLAWSLSATISELKTNAELSKLVSERVFSETYRTHLTYLFPALIFLLAAFMSFSTGTSWGTMGILFPLAIPMCVHLTTGNTFAELQIQFLYMTIGAVLTGAIFGDHCSPISDTTILSSLGSEVDHIDHVQTQMPYAVLVGFLGLVLGYIPCGYGWPLGYDWNPYFWIIIGTLVMAILLRIIGKPVPNYSPGN